jgi:protoporphyrinogen oxidase
MLEPSDKWIAMEGLIDAYSASKSGKLAKPANFDEWIVQNMGVGIADLFMRPYNFKVWACPTSLMQCGWLGERVAAPDLKKVVKNIIYDQAEGNWGPNATFLFPAIGGTQGIWRAIARNINQKKFKFGSTVTKVNTDRKFATLQNGSQISFDYIISTCPIDTFVKMLEPTQLELVKEADGLTFSSTHVIGFGIRGSRPPRIGDKCWLYFPEDDCPFYRATIFSNYSPNNCPDSNVSLKTIRFVNGKLGDGNQKPGPYWSIMLEVSQSARFKPVDVNTIIEDSIRGCVNTTLLEVFSVL